MKLVDGHIFDCLQIIHDFLCSLFCKKPLGSQRTKRIYGQDESGLGKIRHQDMVKLIIVKINLRRVSAYGQLKVKMYSILTHPNSRNDEISTRNKRYTQNSIVKTKTCKNICNK